MIRHRPRTRLAVESLEDRSVPAAGFLDPAFAGDGVATTDVGLNGGAAAYAAAAYPGPTPADDGKVVVAGEAIARLSGGGADFGFALVRYNPDGTPDASFGQNGRVLTNLTGGSDAAVAVRLVGDKVLAGGYAQAGFALARYTAAGSLDLTFGSKGTVVTQVNHGGLGQAMDVDASGRIVMAGTDGAGALTLVRYTPAGALDGTFGSRGVAVTAIPALAGGLGGQMGVAVVPASAGADAGKVVVVGVRSNGTNRAFVARFTAAGSLDPSFGTGGVADLPAGGVAGHPAVAVQPDGRVVAANYQTLIRLTAGGAPDPTFGSGGQVTTTQPDYANAVTVLPDGRLLVAGIEGNDPTRHYFVARYTADGAPDPTFGTGGVGVETEARDGGGRVGLAAEANGKVVIAGYNRGSGGWEDFAAARFLGDSALTAAAVAPSSPARHAPAVTAADARTLLAEALRRWAAAGADVSPLTGLRVHVADLGGATLGLATSGGIWVDDDAAGWGWFVDATPSDDNEFLTPGNQGERNRMDLLSALEHEVGHLLGHDHAEGGVMREALAPGERLAVGGAALGGPGAFAAALDADSADPATGLRKPR